VLSAMFDLSHPTPPDSGETLNPGREDVAGPGRAAPGETVLVLRQQAAASRSTRNDEMFCFIRTPIGPAVPWRRIGTREIVGPL
jgi:hypothetical protein